MTLTHVTWSNYRSHLPKDVDVLAGYWRQRSLEEVTLETIFKSGEASLEAWQALILKTVLSLTSGSAFPAKIYGGDGRKAGSVAWNESSRDDLVSDVWQYLLGQGASDTLHSGNQFIFMIRHAETVDHVTRLLRRYGKQVLRARFREQAMGHLSELLLKELKSSFRTVPPNSLKPRDRYYTNDKYDVLAADESNAAISIAVNEFKLMRRNKIEWGVQPDSETRTFPRLYNRNEIRKAVSRIIAALESPIRMGFLEDCLDKALVHLDEAISDEKDSETDENGSQVPDFVPNRGGNVQVEDLHDLSDGDESDDVGDIGPVGHRYESVEVADTVNEMKEALSPRQIRIMRLHMRQNSLKEIAEKLNISEKTVSRDLDAIKEPLQAIMKESVSELDKTDITVVLKALYQLGLDHEGDDLD